MLLEITNLHVFYNQIHAVKGLSFFVDQGEIVTIIGANGAGKSTTLMTISGVVPAQRGAIVLDGRPVTNMRLDHIARLGLNLVPEGRHIFPDFTVAENLQAGAYRLNDAAKIKALQEKVFELFPRLKERIRQRSGTLSGGEQQMLAIARGLMSDPKILLLDEPSLGLAPMIKDNIFEHILDINKQGITVLLVEQNAQLALQIAHRGYVLETGSIAVEGRASELRSNELVRRAYLGIAG